MTDHPDRDLPLLRAACRLIAPAAGVPGEEAIDREALRLFGEPFDVLSRTETLRFVAWLAARAVRLAEGGGEGGA